MGSSGKGPGTNIRRLLSVICLAVIMKARPGTWKYFEQGF